MNHHCIGLRRLASTAALFAALAICGCGGEKSMTSAVRGTVTYKGKPVVGATISFQPVKIDAGLPNRTAQGSTDAAGHYSLSTIKVDDGAVPGEYAVVVFTPAGPEPIDGFTKPAAASAGNNLPAIYADAQRTPLKVTVTAGGWQQMDFELKD
jgi:hypothetical protein